MIARIFFHLWKRTAIAISHHIRNTTALPPKNPSVWIAEYQLGSFIEEYAYGSDASCPRFRGDARIIGDALHYSRQLWPEFIKADGTTDRN